MTEILQFMYVFLKAYFVAYSLLLISTRDSAEKNQTIKFIWYGLVESFDKKIDYRFRCTYIS